MVESELRSVFPQRLRQALQYYGWTQSELARRSQVSPVMVTQMVLGNRLPSYHTFKKLLNAFWCTPGDFFVGRSDVLNATTPPFKTLEVVQ